MVEKLCIYCKKKLILSTKVLTGKTTYHYSCLLRHIKNLEKELKPKQTPDYKQEKPTKEQ